MRRRKWSLSEKVLFLTPLGFVVAANWTFLVPRDRVFRGDILQRVIDDKNPLRAHESNCGRGNHCGSHLKIIGLGLLQYAQDNDEKLPPVQTSGKFYGWADATSLYIKAPPVFHCPGAATRQTTVPQSRGYTSYYLNARLSARNRDFNNWNQLVMAGEGDDGLDANDARYSKSHWAAAWETSLKSPLSRHLSDQIWATRGSYFLFGDGHAKFLSSADFEAGRFAFEPH